MNLNKMTNDKLEELESELKNDIENLKKEISNNISSALTDVKKLNEKFKKKIELLKKDGEI